MSADFNKQEKRILMKDNLLVKTKYELTLAENRLYNLILYKFQKEGQVLKCTLTQSEIKEVIKFNDKGTIRGIGELLDSLSIKKIWIEEKKSNGLSKWHKYNLLNGCTYDEEFKTFEIEATGFIYELIKKKFSNGGYTPNNLNIFLTLGNYYGQRLYELLRLWSNVKTTINYSVDELKSLLMVEEKYPLYGDFKRRVIIPAVTALNKSKAFEIDIREIKVGRKVESIDFIVKDLDKRKYFEKTTDEQFKSSNKKELKDLPINNNEIFIPDESVFAKGTLRSFKIDFADIDFKDEYMLKAFDKAIMITLDRDNVEIIEYSSYPFLKGTLENKIEELKKEKEKDMKHEEEMSKYW
ncbi:MAG: replication initiation protein [Peptostreptococcaceae bacterium]